MLSSWRGLLLLGLITVLGPGALVRAQQPLETETARPPKAHSLEVETAFEYQTSKVGTERALPLAFEYGITDRFSLLVEPVFYTSIRPKQGLSATGLGDLEITLDYLVKREGRWIPALAVAGEVKAPTARNILIGTGETDYAAYLIASKRVGKFDTHANISYTFIGQPPGIRLSNIINFALAEEYFVNQRWAIVGEVLTNTASTPNTGEGSGVTQPGVVSEAPAGEMIGMIGFRSRIREGLYFTLGFTYDNNRAVLIRPGLTFDFNRPGRTRPQ